MNKSVAITFIILFGILSHSASHASAAASPTPANAKNLKPLPRLFHASPVNGGSSAGGIRAKVQSQRSPGFPKFDARTAESLTTGSAKAPFSQNNAHRNRIADPRKNILSEHRNPEKTKKFTGELQPLALELKKMNPQMAPTFNDPLVQQHQLKATIEQLFGQMKKMINADQLALEAADQLDAAINEKIKLLANSNQADALLKRHIELQIKFQEKAINVLIKHFIENPHSMSFDKHALNARFYWLLKMYHKLRKLDPAKAQVYNQPINNIHKLIKSKLKQKALNCYKEIYSQLILKKPNFDRIVARFNEMQAIANQLNSMNSQQTFAQVNEAIKKIGIMINHSPIHYYLHCIAIELNKLSLDIDKIDELFDAVLERFTHLPNAFLLYKTPIASIIAKLETVIYEKFLCIDKELAVYQGLPALSETLKSNLYQLACLINHLEKIDSQKVERYKKALIEKRAYIGRYARIYERGEVFLIKLQELEAAIKYTNERESDASRVEEITHLMHVIEGELAQLKLIAPQQMVQFQDFINQVLSAAMKHIKELEEKIKKETKASPSNEYLEKQCHEAQTLLEQIKKLLEAEYPDYNTIDSLFEKLKQFARHESDVSENEMHLYARIAEIKVKILHNKLLFCLKFIPKRIAEIKAKWEEKILDNKKIHELQESLTQEILNVLDYHTDSGYHPAYKAEIIQLVEKAWPYIFPDAKDQAEIALKKLKELNNTENKKIFVEAFNELMKFIKIAQYAPAGVRVIFQELYCQMTSFIIAIDEQEIQIALEILYKKIESGNTIDNEITHFIQRMEKYIKINRNKLNFCMDIYRSILKKIIDQMELLKQKIKNDPATEKMATLASWSLYFVALENIICELENTTKESCEREKAILDEHRQLFFEEYCLIIKNQLEIATHTLNEMTQKLNIDAINKQLQQIVNNAETILNQHIAQYFNKNIDQPIFISLKQTLLKQARLLEDAFFNLVTTIMKISNNDPTIQLKLCEARKSVCLAHQKLIVALNARNLIAFNDKLSKTIQDWKSATLSVSTQPAVACSAGVPTV